MATGAAFVTEAAVGTEGPLALGTGAKACTGAGLATGGVSTGGGAAACTVGTFIPGASNVRTAVGCGSTGRATGTAAGAACWTGRAGAGVGARGAGVGFVLAAG